MERVTDKTSAALILPSEITVEPDGSPKSVRIRVVATDPEVAAEAVEKYAEMVGGGRRSFASPDVTGFRPLTKRSTAGS